jgi:hypothetical protein
LVKGCVGLWNVHDDFKACRTDAEVNIKAFQDTSTDQLGTTAFDTATALTRKCLPSIEAGLFEARSLPAGNQ